MPALLPLFAKTSKETGNIPSSCVVIPNNTLHRLSEAFVAFAKGNFIESHQILNMILEQYEMEKIENNCLLNNLDFLETQCKIRIQNTNESNSNQFNTDNKDRSTIKSESLSSMRRQEWNIMASKSAQNTINPIRRLVDGCKLSQNPQKQLISLSIKASQIVKDVVDEPRAHACAPACGMEEARESVARLWSRPGCILKSKDIILTNGCSHALEMCINCLADPGDNILIPQPGFSLYATLCQTLHIEPKYYKLKPKDSWAIDLENLESGIDAKTKAIIVNNPSNPCGTVYSAEQLQGVIAICEKYKLPIIADEIYAEVVFHGKEFQFMGTISKTVPVLSCGGLSKRYNCSGWRVGWIAIYDRLNRLNESVRAGMFDFSTRILGPNSIIQTALPRFLTNIPNAYFDSVITQLEDNANVCYNILLTAPGLHFTLPSASMYMLVGFDPNAFVDIENDKVFFEKLCNEQSVSCLPASVFGISNYFRLVLTAPLEKTREACERIVEFCFQHAKM